MIYPIVAFGDPVLKKVAEDLVKGDMDIKTLVNDMFETMYNAHGVGLAAPQIGKSIRLFVIDAEGFDEDECKGFKRAFINPEILEESDDEWAFEEGCLSIPGIREEVWRPEEIKIKYLDENWVEKTEVLNGLNARVFQHEYDHIEGVLFTDYLSPLKKRINKNKFLNISKGKVDVDYRMKFPK